MGFNSGFKGLKAYSMHHKNSEVGVCGRHSSNGTQLSPNTLVLSGK